MSTIDIASENRWFRAGAAVRRIVSRHPFALIVGALALGIFIGQSNLFGYSSAEACAAQAKTRWSVGACYELYPSIHDAAK
ncbi:hypothetical protein G167_gp15 [Burkholderia phage BcepMigl]|uniref:Uncharacterized protein n=1 Tax=Burkholderia phage BcepMigl TaxID=2886899 RepID=I6XKX0_9CAUD|nr:hypothetical protein G167_gp15 [Burkholderia phage BcepMigl]AFN39139.1 hypothetical protein BcepMigl_gp70 [Burkholderia phage BcepMigl]